MTPTKPEDALVELQHRVAKAIDRVIWPLADWDGDPLNASSAAGKAAIAAIEASGITTLLERERRKDEALRQFGQHKGGCRMRIAMGQSCVCGWAKARAALTGMDK